MKSFVQYIPLEFGGVLDLEIETFSLNQLNCSTSQLLPLNEKTIKLSTLSSAMNNMLMSFRAEH